MCCRELTFKKGDAVNIIRQIDNNWYEGEHRGRVGIFPMSYVEVSVQLINCEYCIEDVHHCLSYMQFVSLISLPLKHTHLH